MTIKRLKGRREALSANSELFKDKLIQYLEKRGFYIQSSSDVESDLPDLVFSHKFEETSNWMEVKATSTSLKNKEFLSQLGQYLTEFLKRSPRNRFKFWLASYRLVSSKTFEEIFEDYNRKAIQSLVQKIAQNVDDSSRLILQNANINDIIDFFETAEIIEGEPFDLGISREKISPLAPDEPTLDDMQYAEKIRSNFDHVEPIIEEHLGYANLFPIILPEVFYVSMTPYSNPMQIYDQNYGIRFPPFIIKEKKLYTFDNVNNSILRSYVNTHSSEEVKLSEWLEKDTLNVNSILDLVNKWINNQCRNEGMWVDKRTRTYFFPKPKGRIRALRKRWTTPKGVKRNRIMTNPYIKDNILNFWAHKSVQVRARYYWDDFFIRINPRWLFSNDGLSILEGEKADKLDRNFRKSQFNRNKNLFYNTLIWYELLFKHTRRDTPNKLDSFFSLKFNPIEVKSCISFKLLRVPHSEIDEESLDIDSLDLINLDDFW